MENTFTSYHFFCDVQSVCGGDLKKFVHVQSENIRSQCIICIMFNLSLCNMLCTRPPLWRAILRKLSIFISRKTRSHFTNNLSCPILHYVLWYIDGFKFFTCSNFAIVTCFSRMRLKRNSEKPKSAILWSFVKKVLP